MGTPHWVYYILLLAVSGGSSRKTGKNGLYTYTYVGLSALLVSTSRAMRRPRCVERAKAWLHVFCICSSNSQLYFVILGAEWRLKNEEWENQDRHLFITTQAWKHLWRCSMVRATKIKKLMQTNFLILPFMHPTLIKWMTRQTVYCCSTSSSQTLK